MKQRQNGHSGVGTNSDDTVVIGEVTGDSIREVVTEHLKSHIRGDLGEAPQFIAWCVCNLGVEIEDGHPLLNAFECANINPNRTKTRGLCRAVGEFVRGYQPTLRREGARLFVTNGTKVDLTDVLPHSWYRAILDDFDRRNAKYEIHWSRKSSSATPKRAFAEA